MSDIAPNLSDEQREAMIAAYEPATGFCWQHTPDRRFPEDYKHQEGFESGYIAGLAATHPIAAPDIADRTNLARALGLAQAIARAKPYPVEMDGVRAVAGEIVTLLEGILAVAHPVPEDAWLRAVAKLKANTMGYVDLRNKSSWSDGWDACLRAVRYLPRR